MLHVSFDSCVNMKLSNEVEMVPTGLSRKYAHIESELVCA
jgi:hypothetical protein